MSATNPPACLETCYAVSSWLFLMKLQVAFSTSSFPCLCFLLHGTRSCLLLLFEMADLYRADTNRIQFCALTRTWVFCGSFWKLQGSECTIGLCRSKLLSSWSVLAAWFLLPCHSPQFCCHCVSPAPSPSCGTSLSRRGAEQMDAFPIMTTTCSFPSALTC